MRKDIYKRIKIMKKELKDITPNFALLAKQYGCDYRTLKDIGILILLVH